MYPSIILSSLTPILFLYTDPGSGALLLQLIVATLLGGLFYFRKLKDWILGKRPETTKGILSESNSKGSLKATEE